MVSLIKNNVTIRVTRSLSAGVCKLICRYFSSTAPQRLNAKDMAWLVGFVEGDGWFSITKNGIYCKYEFGVSISRPPPRRRTREGMVIFKLTSKAPTIFAILSFQFWILILCLLPSIGIILIYKQSSK